MVPQIKKSTDTLVERFEEEVESQKSFNVHKYVTRLEKEKER